MTRLVILKDVLGELLVDAANAMSCIEEQDHIGATDRPLGAVHAVKLDVTGETRLLADARRIDGDE